MSDDELIQDETMITEITIQPDGRLYVFGTSRQVLEVLDDLRPRDARVGRMLQQARVNGATNIDDGGKTSAT